MAKTKNKLREFQKFSGWKEMEKKTDFMIQVVGGTGRVFYCALAVAMEGGHT